MGRKIFLLVAFFVGLAWAMTVKCVRWWQHWAAVSLDVVVRLWRRRAGWLPDVAQTVGQSQFRHSCRAGGVCESWSAC